MIHFAYISIFRDNDYLQKWRFSQTDRYYYIQNSSRGLHVNVLIHSLQLQKRQMCTKNDWELRISNIVQTCFPEQINAKLYNFKYVFERNMNIHNSVSCILYFVFEVVCAWLGVSRTWCTIVIHPLNNFRLSIVISSSGLQRQNRKKSCNV